MAAGGAAKEWNVKELESLNKEMNMSKQKLEQVNKKGKRRTDQQVQKVARFMSFNWLELTPICDINSSLLL
jgi:hypothetical protein